MSNSANFFGDTPPPFASGLWPQGAAAVSQVNFQVYVKKTADATHSTDPANDSTNWALPGASKIRSIQYGTISLGSGATSNTATITSVNWSFATLTPLGSAAYGNTNSLPYVTDVVLTPTNSTTVTATRGNQDGVTSLTVGFMVVEYWPS